MIVNDLRFAWRGLVKAPSFTLIVVATLALGIGANTAIFSVIHSVLFRALPYPDPDRLVMFWEKYDTVGVDYVPINEAAYFDWKQRQQAFSAMAGFRIRSHSTGRPVIVSGDWTPLRVNGVTCSSSLFETLGVKPLFGRDFREGEDLPGAAPVVILAHGLWQRLYGGDPGIVGQTLKLDGSAYQIVGVMPPGFFFPPPLKFAGNVREGAGDVFFPYPFRSEYRGVRSIRVVARLRPGVTIPQAEAALKPVAEELLEMNPDETLKGAGAVVLPLHEQAVDLSRARLILLACAVGAILLIACVNVANLLLARAAERKREIAVRSALGAPRGQIIRLLLTESILLSLLGGVAGVLLAGLGLPPLLLLSSRYIPSLGPVTLEAPVLAFTLIVTVVTGLLIGLLPALRVSKPSLREDLKEGTRGGTVGRRSEALRKTLVVVEVAAATILLIGAGLLVRSLWKAQEVDLGFRTERILAVQTWLPPSEYREPAKIISFYDEVLREIQALPQIRAVGAVNLLPFSPGLFGGNFEIEGSKGDDSSRTGQVADYRVVAGDYLEALGIELVAGRGFLPSDRAGAQPVVLVDQGLIERFWPGDRWKAGRIEILQDKAWRSIVGVVRDIRHKSLRASNQGIIYVPLAQNPDAQMALVVAYEGEAPGLPELLRQRISARDADVPVDVRSMESYLSDAHSGLRSPSILLGLMALLALLLALVGLYGVIAHMMARRRREIGIRIALGAEQGQILRMAGGEAGRLVALGIVFGLLGALAVSRLLSSFLFGVTGADPVTYVVVTLLFLAISGLATFLPIRQASRLNPVESLRAE